MNKKLTKKDAEKIFKLVQNMEDLHWANIHALETTLLSKFNNNYELAIVGGDIVGIGQITKTGKKIIFHR